jgi:hypothetical protein
MATDKRARRRRRLLMVGVSALVGMVAAVINTGIVGGVPPKPRLHNLDIATATTYLDVDTPTSMPTLAHSSNTPPADLQTYVKRAELLGRVLVSPPVLARIAQRCGLPRYQVSGLGWVTANVPFAYTEPDSEQRASDIEASKAPYQIEVQARQTVPVIDVYSEAPTMAAALCLGNASPLALTDYLRSLASQQGSTAPLVRIEPLGAASGSIANGSATLEIALLTFLTVFWIAFGALAAGAYLRRRRRGLQVTDSTRAQIMSEPASPLDNWPHTGRPLPWLLAGLIAILWLTPFNDISLNANLPVELRLDRMILPFVVIAWVVAIVGARRGAPRLRVTWIHVALGALLAVAFLSVVTDARYLNQTLDFTLSLKKLPLMLAYASVFVVTASAVRRAEVRPFLTYTLALAFIVALAMIYEYRTKQNLFWNWSGKLLPSGFTLNTSSGTSAVDSIGRRIVRGPAEVPLEAVAMLTMALPIALTRILQARAWRQRLVYGVIICTLVAATVATYRKSALIAPVSVVLTMAYFRRRELLKLAPLGMVMLVMVTAVAPGAIHSTFREFTRSDATSVPTVSDRTAAYDAIRPDVWTHLLLGRGWGSYDHNTYRILDSEILDRIIETGVVGFIAFLMLPITVVLASRKTIAARDPSSAPVALIGACAAVAFLVLAFLFDEMSFPHAVYIFLYLAGLETVVLRPAGQPAAGRAPPASASVPRREPARAPLAVAQAGFVLDR